jgi:hypothetical protein
LGPDGEGEEAEPEHEGERQAPPQAAPEAHFACPLRRPGRVVVVGVEATVVVVLAVGATIEVEEVEEVDDDARDDEVDDEEVDDEEVDDDGAPTATRFEGADSPLALMAVR